MKLISNNNNVFLIYNIFFQNHRSFNKHFNKKENQEEKRLMSGKIKMNYSKISFKEFVY